MPSTLYDFPINSETVRRTTTAWLMLGLVSLVGAWLFSLLLVLARTPTIQEWLPFIDFFRVALVVHVDLSVMIWLLSMAGVLWALSTDRDSGLLPEHHEMTARLPGWGLFALSTPVDLP